PFRNLSARKARASSGGQSRPTMRILVVEDDLILADGIANALRAAGHAVDGVASGLDADAALTADEYELVVLDIELPKFDGFEVLRRLRRRKSTTPVLVL